MRPQRKKELTFFNKKSEALNATILEALGQYCSDRVFDLTGMDYKSYSGRIEDTVQNPRADDLLTLVVERQASRSSYEHLVEAYAWARRYDALYSKNASLDLNIDREKAAYDKFLESEEQCRRTNKRFNGDHLSDVVFGISARSVFHRLSRKIAGILGEAPSLDDLHCSFGPGSSTTCKKKTSAKWKLSSQLAVSKDARDCVTTLASLYPRMAWETLKLDVGQLSFVPKTAKTHRSIMVEPVVNTFVQRGIGSLIKRRLSRAGCNLYDQSRNREFARVGSKFGTFATVDLSSASDNISYNVVRELLPWDWYELLASWRTGICHYKKENRYFVLEKFSSMGNGFTFELESCIFYAAAQLSCELVGISTNSIKNCVGTYGDDIIVPTDAVAALYAILAFLGFTVNEAKSFSDGPFRESCGADFVLGVDVRPFYVKDCITDARLVAMSNQVARSGFPDKAFRKLIESYINPRNQKFGPEGYGDGHLIGYDWERQHLHRDRGYEGYVFQTFAKEPVRDTAMPFANLYDPENSGHGYGLLPAYICHEKDLRVSDAWDELFTRKPNLAVFLKEAQAIGIWEQLIPSTRRAFARESDVHVIRGGERARVLRVYVPPFVA